MSDLEDAGNAAPGADPPGDPTITRKVGRLTITVDRLLCVGFGDCIEEAPEAFEFDDEGIAILTNPAEVDRERLLHACEICPVDAITIVDEDGRQIVPEA
ncbi:MAG: ferredoxin [Gemmatimonadota bacterium]